MKKESLDLFVLGNPRSGTTVFRLALAAHPEICIPPECGFALWLAKTWRDKEFPPSFSDFVDEVICSRKFETWNLSREEIVAIGEKVKPQNYSEATACIYRAYAEKIGKGGAILGDKNNFYINELELLGETYPKAKVAWICRDPRDVFCSYKDLNKRDLSTKYAPKLEVDPVEFSTEWLKSDDQRFKAAREYGATFTLVRYEDLVSNPEESLSSVVRLLNLNFDQEMLEFYRKSDEPKQFLQWKEKTRQPFSSSSVGRYRSDLTKQELEVIEEKLGIRMATLGYQCS